MPAATTYPGIGGFLGSRGSLMLDVVFLAMFVVVPVLAVSIYLTKIRRRYDLHKKLQLITATVLLIAVILFELDIRLNGWEQRASGIPPGTGSPYFDAAHKWTCPAGISLIIHLSFAIPTLVLWIVVVVRALRNFPRSPQPASHSRWHACYGWCAATGMLLTALTGWLFYYLAFVATSLIITP
jgi:uncharacterized membrane protein YozB (DUF420 family)